MKSLLSIATMSLIVIVTGVICAGLLTPSTGASFTPFAASAALANAGADITVYAGESVRLDGTASNGVIGQSRWTTGDGYTIESILKAPHAYMTAGTYTAQLTIIETAGIASTD